LRKEQESTLDEAAYQARFPHCGDLIRAVFRAPSSLSLGPGLPSGTSRPGSALPPGLGDHLGLTARAAGYDLLHELGRGGMAIVYLAWQNRLKRLVALKVVQAWAHADANLRARFRAEATAVARLQHPHIVQIHEVAEQASALFLALEYVEGGTLAAK